MRMTLAQIAELLGSTVEGDTTLVMTSVASLESAGPSDISFVANAATLRRLAGSRAGAVVAPPGLDVDDRPVIRHKVPHFAMATLVAVAHPEPPPSGRVHELASVAPDVVLGEDVTVDAFAVVGAGATLGDGARIGAGSYVGAGSTIGPGTLLHPGAVVRERVQTGRDCVIHPGAVIGGDGFGFVRYEGRHRKVPQVGGVVLGDEVEIGSNACVDSGTLDPTVVGDNTKIDNLVQVGHNCRIGKRVILCGQVGIAGSTTIEDDVTMAGQAGATGQITIGAQSMIGAKSAALSNVKPGSVVGGVPSMPLVEWRKASKAFRHLPDLRKEVRALRKQLAALEARLADE